MISRDEIEHLAELARLKLTEEEIAPLQKDISSILEYVEHLSETTFSGPKDDKQPAYSPLKNIMREDSPRAEGDILAGKEEALRAAFPRREGDYNVVRKILNKDE